jgi:hypothetical protein
MVFDLQHHAAVSVLWDGRPCVTALSAVVRQYRKGLPVSGRGFEL